jgi:hypothetical protein
MRIFAFFSSGLSAAQMALTDKTASATAEMIILDFMEFVSFGLVIPDLPVIGQRDRAAPGQLREIRRSQPKSNERQKCCR